MKKFFTICILTLIISQNLSSVLAAQPPTDYHLICDEHKQCSLDNYQPFRVQNFRPQGYRFLLSNWQFTNNYSEALAYYLVLPNQISPWHSNLNIRLESDTPGFDIDSNMLVLSDNLRRIFVLQSGEQIDIRWTLSINNFNPTLQRQNYSFDLAWVVRDFAPTSTPTPSPTPTPEPTPSPSPSPSPSPTPSPSPEPTPSPSPVPSPQPSPSSTPVPTPTPNSNAGQDSSAVNSGNSNDSNQQVVENYYSDVVHERIVSFETFNHLLPSVFSAQIANSDCLDCETYSTINKADHESMVDGGQVLGASITQDSENE
ncbi:MAG: hypothetical protein LBG64_03230, partial [Pseudomonadales bacterium]|nr:hypothetical protein [Pseudomonadales bacterium]